MHDPLTPAPVRHRPRWGPAALRLRLRRRHRDGVHPLVLRRDVGRTGPVCRRRLRPGGRRGHPGGRRRRVRGPVRRRRQRRRRAGVLARRRVRRRHDRRRR
ncbi:hypothetical protein GB931_15445 [Modestobacter sp. I12A-02628]|nr:hypothetical protein [Goekera deserti]